MNSDRCLTSREKDVLLKSIIKEYHKAKIHLNMLENKVFYSSVQYSIIQEHGIGYNGLENTIINNMEKKETLKTIISLFDNVYNSLTEEEKHVIKNEFIAPSYREWWRGYYSRATFYRIKKRAVDNMLFYLLK